MGRVFKPYYTRPGPDGTRERVQVRDWYIAYTDAAGVVRRERVGRDKRTAQAALAAAQERAARARAGLSPAPASGELARPLDSLLAEYLGVLEAKARAPGYVAGVRARVGAGLRACGWLVWADVRADGLSVFFGGLRKAGRSPATCNGYLRDVRGFVRWVGDRLGAADPLRKLKPLNEEVDRRRSKLTLTDDEFAGLLAAAAAAPRRHKTVINGPSRAVLYRVAAYTGLRASELASLEPRHFALDGDPPTVTPAAAFQKGRREDAVPLPAHLVPVLREFLAGKKPGERLWPGDWAYHRRQVRWVWRDLRRAGIGTRGPKGQQLGPDGKPYHFHSLRRKYATALIRTAGADPDQLRRLARHRSLKTTMDHYVGSDLAELGAVVDRLPPPPAAAALSGPCPGSVKGGESSETSPVRPSTGGNGKTPGKPGF